MIPPKNYRKRCDWPEGQSITEQLASIPDDRRDAKTHLELLQQRLRVSDITLSTIIDFAYILDRDGRFVYANKPLLDLWGLTLSEAKGKNFYDLHYPQDLAARLHGQVQQVFDTRERLVDETYYTSPSGTQGYYEYIFTPVLEASGRVEAVAGSTRDITARKRAEEAVRRRTAQYETLLNYAPLGVYLIDGDFKIRDVNPTALRVFGEITNLIGRNFDEVIHILWAKDYADELVQRFRHTLESGEPYIVSERIEYRLDRAQREYYDWQINRIPLPDGSQGVVCYFRDTSAQVHARLALAESEERYRRLAERLDAEVRSRTSELEVRNSELVQQSLQVHDLSGRLMQAQDEERRHIARELHDTAGQILAALSMHLARLMNHAAVDAPDLKSGAEMSQMLVHQLSQEIRTTSYLLHPPLLEENGLPKTLSWFLQGFKDRSGLAVQITISDDFGRLPREMELTIFRIVQECLTNIHRHAGTKKAAVRITRSPKSVSLEIQDHGHGIPEEKLNELHRGGSGVGIRGIRERILQLKGDMEVSSSETGTTVSVTLPTP
jgi:PAS domain S-box-containing protein